MTAHDIVDAPTARQWLAETPPGLVRVWIRPVMGRIQRELASYGGVIPRARRLGLLAAIRVLTEWSTTNGA